MTSPIVSNAARLAQIQRDRIGRWAVALSTGLRKALARADAEIQRFLSGGGKPFSYPVPVRTGNLRRSEGMRVLSATSGMVFNTASYANAIHGGRVGEWAGKGKVIIRIDRPGRPFMDDGVEAAKPNDIVFDSLLRAL